MKQYLHSLLVLVVLTIFSLSHGMQNVIDTIKTTRKTLQDTQAQIKAGKEGLRNGYWSLQEQAIAPLQKALNTPVAMPGISVNNITELPDKLDKFHKDAQFIDVGLAALIPTIILAPLGAAGLALFGDAPFIIEQLRDTVKATIVTLNQALTDLQYDVRPLNPNSYLNSVEYLEKISNNANEISSSFITFLKQSADPISEQCKPEAKEAVMQKINELGNLVLFKSDEMHPRAILQELQTPSALPAVYSKFNIAYEAFGKTLKVLDALINQLLEVLE